MKALNALKALMEALNEMGLNLSKWCNWPVVFIPLFRYTREWHGVWTLSCWSLLRRRLFHRALSAPQELLQSGFQDPEVGHVHDGQPLCHSGQGRHAGVLSSPHSVPQRWDHQHPAADRVMLGRLWNATSHTCHDVFLTKPQMSTALYQKQTESFQTFLSSACGGFPRSGSRPDSILSQILACLNISTGARSRAQGWMACFRHRCRTDPWWMTRDTGPANRTKKTHWTQKKPPQNVPGFLDPQKPQEHTRTDVQT